MRKCQRCGAKICDGVANRVKVVGKEKEFQWIVRHIRQIFSFLRHGFIRPEIEGYTELCDSCYLDLRKWLGYC